MFAKVEGMEDPKFLQWRNQCNNIQERWTAAFQKSLFTDMKFLVGEEKKVMKCHSVILTLQSPNFQAKYYQNPFDETGIKHGLEVEVPNYQPKYFSLFLQV